MQNKADPDEDSDSETVIGKTSPLNKNVVAFCDGFARSSARDKKWIQFTECFLWAHVGCSDTKTHMYVCEYCK